MKAKFYLTVPCIFFLPLFTSAAQTRSVPEGRFRDWTIYGGSAENIRYSTLDQINRVLKVAPTSLLHAGLQDAF